MTRAMPSYGASLECAPGGDGRRFRPAAWMVRYRHPCRMPRSKILQRVRSRRGLEQGEVAITQNPAELEEARSAES